MSDASGQRKSGTNVVTLRGESEAPGRAQIAAARRRLHDISRLISDGVWETDVSHRLTFVSNQVFDKLSAGEHELLGRRLIELGSVISMRQPAVNIEGRSPFRDVLYEFDDNRGGRRLLMLNGLPTYNQETGSFEGMQGTARDVTERAGAEKEITELFKAVNDSILIVMIVSTQGEIEYVNAKAMEATGYTMEELKGNTPRLLVPEDVPVSTFEDKWGVIEAGKDWRGDTHYRKKNGKTFRVSESVTPIRTLGGVITHHLWIAEDSHAKKFLQRQPDNEVLVGLQDRLKKVIAVILSGDYFTPPGIIKQDGIDDQGGAQALGGTIDLPDENPIAQFSKRQREVLSLMVRGYSNKEIGRELNVYDTTVKTHVKVICEKLGAVNRTQAAVLAVRLGWS